jgi:hypothetical protein
MKKGKFILGFLLIAMIIGAIAAFKVHTETAQTTTLYYYTSTTVGTGWIYVIIPCRPGTPDNCPYRRPYYRWNGSSWVLYTGSAVHI